ncbi:MAG: flagellar M-ring protein FliF [Lachnospiraceae bacterium]|nr:flagellar M-ring protein FliF [Lachnospiraceae bacterium]
MPEQITSIINRVLEWWQKFTPRQKTFIIAVSAGVTLTLVILVSVLNQTQYVPLSTAANASEGAELRDLLEADGSIRYKVSPDGLRFEVDKRQLASANLLLGANNFQSSAWSIDNVVSGGFSTTEADKQKRYKAYLENQIIEMAMNLTNVRGARVQLDLPDNDGTLLSRDRESSAYIQLELSGEFSEEQAANFAKGISVGLGSRTSQNIVIMDSNGNMLFSGDAAHNASAGSSSNTQLTAKNRAETAVNNEIRRVIMGTNEYDRVIVASNLAIDFSNTRTTDLHYHIPDDRQEGYIAHESHYEAESTYGPGGIPGTDSNDNTSYQWQDNNYSSSSESERSIDRLVSQTITEFEIPPGAIVLQDSSIAVTATTTNVVREEEIRRLGLLDAVTWDEYKAAHAERTLLTVNPAMYSVVANASGIPLDSITILAYSENIFFDAEGMALSWTDIAQILLIVIILGLLAFVVIRSMREGKEAVEEEELSVSELLQSQPELDDITVEEGIESKRVIDKFVEENPEAAAALLRNWLSEDWG